MLRFLTLLAVWLLWLSPAPAEDVQEFWRHEFERQGKQFTSPQLFLQQPSIKEALDPPRDAFVRCLAAKALDSLKANVTPTDFARILEVACPKEANDFSEAALRWWQQTSPQTAYQSGAFSQKIFRTIRNQVAAYYTENWYKLARAKENQARGAAATAGSGFYISKNELLTNSHVVEQCSEIRVGQGSLAFVVARDIADDLAVVRTAVSGGNVATLRVSPPARSGDSVVVFGYPLIGVLASSGNATTGIVTSESGLRNDARHLQISAPIQHGNSGGPLLDMRGNVIGIVDSMLVKTLSGDIPQNVNFAIKSLIAANFLDSNHIAYSSTPLAEDLKTPDIVEKARAFTVPIICLRGAPQPEVKAPVLTKPAEQQLVARANIFLDRLYAATSASVETATRFLGGAYADNLTYYGKQLSREEVLAQTTRFLERWPIRNYRTDENSRTVRCDEVSATCTVTGKLHFDARSPQRQERSFGTATYEYTIVFPANEENAPKITVENGSILERQKQPWTAEPNNG